MRGLHSGSLKRGHPAVGHTPHPYVAVTPGLVRGPLHHLCAIGGLSRVHCVPHYAARVAQATEVNQKVGIAPLSKIAARMLKERTNEIVLVIGVVAHQGRETTWGVWHIQISGQGHSIAQRNKEVAFNSHVITFCLGHRAPPLPSPARVDGGRQQDREARQRQSPLHPSLSLPHLWLYLYPQCCCARRCRYRHCLRLLALKLGHDLSSEQTHVSLH